MSFNELDNLQDLEAQPGGFSDDLEPSPEFTQLVRSIAQNIFQITSNVTSIHRSVGLMGTPRDTDKMRATLIDLLAKTRDISKDTIPQIRTLSAWDPTDIGPSERYEQQKLTGDFQKAATDFQNAQKLALEKEKDFVRGAKAAAAEEGGEEGEAAGEAPRQQERMQLMDSPEMAFNEQLIEERETEIQGIEQGIQELNEIFRDLATIVTEQGTLIDNIEENVNRASQQTRAAAKELTSANRYQKGARKRACYLMLILCVIVTIVLLAILS